MIIEWIFSFFMTWLFPTLFSLFNPFFLPISSCILERKPFAAALSGYFSGILRDIFLATPRFGMVGASSLFSTIVALYIGLYFSLEGFVGSLVITALLTLCDVLFSTCLGAIFCGHAFLSLKALFFGLTLSCLWVVLFRCAPMVLHVLSLRRRRRDSNS